MSIYGTRCEIFEKVLASLIDEQPRLDGRCPGRETEIVKECAA
jgi:hypothetical protein